MPSMSRRFPVGVEVCRSGLDVRIWAPSPANVAVVLDTGESFPLEREGGEHFRGMIPDRGAGTRYKLDVAGWDAPIPDPFSRFQPDGPHGWSEVVDPARYTWHDADWQGLAPDDQVLYEMHVGTFTPEGTWRAAEAHVDALARLGVTCIEMMPIADFPGSFNWGYDGVSLFAPTRNYGTPDDLRSFIDAAHRAGVGVILDVVYNHLGPDGNFIGALTNEFYSTSHKTAWGAPPGFDGENSAGVRELYLSNARYWIGEFRFDGFRFDAIQGLYDDSRPHIVRQIVEECRASAPSRALYFIGEDEPQDSTLVRAPSAGGMGLDALWNDDFHHSARVALTGRREAYFSDYTGAPQELLSAAKWGFLFQGQNYRWQRKPRGTPALDVPPRAFVTFLENHDQVANLGFGNRLYQVSGWGELKALTALLLLGPNTPLIFQGQEFAATSPFTYFSDHEPELAERVQHGRLVEMSQFPSVTDVRVRRSLPAPNSRENFARCKLDHFPATPGRSEPMRSYFRDLIRLRQTREMREARRNRRFDGAVLGVHSFLLRFFGEESDRLLVVNLGVDLRLDVMPEPLLAPPANARWKLMLSSEDVAYGGMGQGEVETSWEGSPELLSYFTIPGRAALFFESVRAPSERIEEERRIHREQERKKGESRARAQSVRH